MYKEVELLNTSISALQNRPISFTFANCSLNFNIIFRQANLIICNNNFCIEEQNETDNNVKIDIDAIKIINRDLFADYIELMISMNDGTQIFIHSF
jgi:hypothetical protein